MSTASREPLDERAPAALLSNSLRRLRPATPLHIARCEAHESAASGHDSFLSRFTRWPPIRATTRPRSKGSERTALRPRPKRQIRPDFRFDIVTLPRPFACQSSMHRSRTQCCPFHSRTSTLNRHRRSTWAGVSWPNDDGIGAIGGDSIGRKFARTRTTRSTRSVTSLCAVSSERLPVRLRASCSRRA